MAHKLPCIPPGGGCVKHGDESLAGNAWLAYSDGSVKKGQATCAHVIFDDEGQLLAEDGFRLGERTLDSNIAEFAGLLNALREAARRGARSLVCLLDSYQVVQALEKARAGKQTRYQVAFDILDTFRLFDYVELRNIANHLNKRADALCTAAR